MAMLSPFKPSSAAAPRIAAASTFWLCIFLLLPSHLSGCATWFAESSNIYELQKDALFDGYTSVVLWRIHVLDKTKTMNQRTALRVMLKDAKSVPDPSQPSILVENPEWVSPAEDPQVEECEDFILYKSLFITQVRQLPLWLLSAWFTTGGNDQVFRFADPTFPLHAKPNSIEHFGILSIEINSVDDHDSGTATAGIRGEKTLHFRNISSSYRIAHDATTEKADLAAIGKSFPSLSKKLSMPE